MHFKALLTAHGKLRKIFRYSSVGIFFLSFLYSHSMLLINTEFYLKVNSSLIQNWTKLKGIHWYVPYPPTKRLFGGIFHINIFPLTF